MFEKNPRKGSFYASRFESEHCAQKRHQDSLRSVRTAGLWHLLLNRQIPVFTFFASNAVVNWQRAHGGRSSYKAKCPQPDPPTTGILPLAASLARGTVLRCLYGVFCYSVYVPIFLYADGAYRVSPCSLWKNRRKQTRLSSHPSSCLSLSFARSALAFLPLHDYLEQSPLDFLANFEIYTMLEYQGFQF
ncbi:hypothetical protein KM043_014289 [Ampulex compressa]|nr:hypothetical protein KM043_014289 [Ampulex compressa]